MKADIIERIQDSINTIEGMKKIAPTINKIVDLIVNAYRDQRKVLIFGNGGSAAQAQHVAGEFIGRFFLERNALRCHALNSNTSILTALGNDYGFDTIFRRQLEGVMDPEDIVIGLTTSGNSANVVEAFKYAKEKGGITIAFVGEKVCKLDSIAQISLKIPSSITPRVQEGHIIAAHIICEMVEKLIFA